jgi:hypothetical protein
MEFKETKETELKDLELLIEQREKMLEMLKEIANQIEDGRTYVTKDDIEKLIKEATEI